uniref:Uncharacterized protein n=1 Tax=Mus spicilegus TaxID=10103 RepID=A0A8C6GIJ2_MUSSI
PTNLVYELNSKLSRDTWQDSAFKHLSITRDRAPSSPEYYHVLYKGHAQAQMAWHGETYCLIGGYRVYGDAPLPTPAKAEQEKKSSSSRAPKRHQVQEESDQDLGCPSAKIPRLKLKLGDKW